MTTKTTPLTPNQFRANLAMQGKTLKQWAIEHGYTSQYEQEYCSRVLTGMVKGVRGKGHDIKVAMGLKLDPNADVTADSEAV